MTGLFIFLAYKSLGTLDYDQVSLSRIHLAYFIAAIVSFSTGLIFRSLAWKNVLGQDLSFKRAYQGVSAGMAMNMLVPFRMGEALKIVILSHKNYQKNKKELKDYYHVTMNILLERIMDVFILVLCLMVSIVLIKNMQSFQARLLPLIMIGFLVLLFLSLSLLFIHKKEIIIKQAFFKKILEKLEGLKPLIQAKKLRKLFLYLLLTWTMVYISTVFGLMSLKIPMKESFIAALIVLVFSNFAILLPTAPGGIGAFQYACIYGLGLLNIESSLALMASILLHLTQYLAALPMGLIGFLTWRFQRETRD
jgi:hypothetical protein